MSRRIRWAGSAVRMGAKGNACRILFGMPEAKRPLRRPGHRLEDNIKMDIKFSGVDWINLAEDAVQWLALVNRVLDSLVP
jgi:hypothetical protein